MKICVDENIPFVTVAELRGLGHDVLDVRGTIEQGLPDDLLWEKAQREKRLLIYCRAYSVESVLTLRIKWLCPQSGGSYG